MSGSDFTSNISTPNTSSPIETSHTFHDSKSKLDASIQQTLQQQKPLIKYNKKCCQLWLLLGYIACISIIIYLSIQLPKQILQSTFDNDGECDILKIRYSRNINNEINIDDCYFNVKYKNITTCDNHVNLDKISNDIESQNFECNKYFTLNDIKNRINDIKCYSNYNCDLIVLNPNKNIYKSRLHWSIILISIFGVLLLCIVIQTIFVIKKYRKI